MSTTGTKEADPIADAMNSVTRVVVARDMVITSHCFAVVIPVVGPTDFPN